MLNCSRLASSILVSSGRAASMSLSRFQKLHNTIKTDIRRQVSKYTNIGIIDFGIFICIYALLLMPVYVHIWHHWLKLRGILDYTYFERANRLENCEEGKHIKSRNLGNYVPPFPMCLHLRASYPILFFTWNHIFGMTCPLGSSLRRIFLFLPNISKKVMFSCCWKCFMGICVISPHIIWCF